MRRKKHNTLTDFCAELLKFQKCNPSNVHEVALVSRGSRAGVRRLRNNATVRSMVLISCIHPEHGSPDGAWRWRELPHIGVQRDGGAGCVLSDGRFAFFGGLDINDVSLSSCEALTLVGDERREPLPPMLEARIHNHVKSYFALSLFRC
jgi:hypothetical protein